MNPGARETVKNYFRRFFCAELFFNKGIDGLLFQNQTVPIAPTLFNCKKEQQDFVVEDYLQNSINCERSIPHLIMMV